MTQLMESFFIVYHVSYPFFHEATFRAQFHGFAHIATSPPIMGDAASYSFGCRGLAGES
ncbi:hypothetical protein BJ170DRAFT_639751 [Xylariales sp. AK1849]|nr:hypothetical protein BJ170DRAFT_639751 [Xylariales sp. AK1849]